MKTVKLNNSRITILSLVSLAVIAIAFLMSGLSKAHMVLSTYDPTVPTVIIDAGHGGFDAGATGVDGILEKDINLEIALKLEQILTLNGWNVIMTRTTDTDTSAGYLGEGSQKVKDIRSRLDLTVQNPHAVLVSIHQNKYPIESIWGAQVFYGPKNEASEDIAEIVQSNLIELLQPQNDREIKRGNTNHYLLYNSEVPTVMVECGFISNHTEADKLTTPEYQQEVAFILFSSLLEYFGSNSSNV